MAARAIWKARLVVGEETLGVKLFAAVEQSAISFHLLHARDGSRIAQRMAHPRTGRTVPAEEMLRGLEVARGRYVVLDDEELAALEPEPSRDILVTRFVPPEALEHRWYERPYYLGPDEGEEVRYESLSAALASRGRIGVARWTMRKREYSGALCLHAGRPALVALRSAQELVPIEGLEPPIGRALEARERALAKQLVEALSGDFDPEAWHDDHRERVLALVEAKRAGRKIRLERFEPEAASDESLSASLEASLRKAG